MISHIASMMKRRQCKQEQIAKTQSSEEKHPDSSKQISLEEQIYLQYPFYLQTFIPYNKS